MSELREASVRSVGGLEGVKNERVAAMVFCKER